jgi:hypothetical protein
VVKSFTSPGRVDISVMSKAETELTARIPVTPETREALKERKRGRDRYEEVVQRLIDTAEKMDDET